MRCALMQVGHIVSETLTPPNKDFYQHQIEHTHNYGTNSLMCFYFSGGLNMQVMHTWNYVRIHTCTQSQVHTLTHAHAVAQEHVVRLPTL